MHTYEERGRQLYGRDNIWIVHHKHLAIVGRNELFPCIPKSRCVPAQESIAAKRPGHLRGRRGSFFVGAAGAMDFVKNQKEGMSPFGASPLLFKQ